MSGDDINERRVGGVVHGGGRQGQTVAEALRNHDLGRKSRGLQGRVECSGENVELPSVPNRGFVSGIPVGFVLTGNGVEGDAKTILDVLDVAHQVAGVTGIGTVGGA